MHNCKGKKSNAYSIQVRAADILLFKKACCVVITPPRYWEYITI